MRRSAFVSAAAGLEIDGRDEDVGALVARREQHDAAEGAEDDEQHAGDDPRRVAVSGVGDATGLEPGRRGRRPVAAAAPRTSRRGSVRARRAHAARPGLVVVGHGHPVTTAWISATGRS